MINFVVNTLSYLVSVPFKIVAVLIKPLLFLLVALLFARRFFRRRPQTVTACKCTCIIISPYIANGVKTAHVAGCLHCDHSNRLQQAAEQTLATLRSKRNKQGFWALTSATLSFLGSATTGPIFEVFSGSSVGAAVKTGRFFSINSAVNRLKPFVADVLERRSHVANCQCDPLASTSSLSGSCDLSGGKYDAMMNKADDSDAVEFDREELLDHFVSEMDAGSTFVDAALALFDFS